MQHLHGLTLCPSHARVPLVIVQAVAKRLHAGLLIYLLYLQISSVAGGIKPAVRGIWDDVRTLTGSSYANVHLWEAFSRADAGSGQYSVKPLPMLYAATAGLINPYP